MCRLAKYLISFFGGMGVTEKRKKAAQTGGYPRVRTEGRKTKGEREVFLYNSYLSSNCKNGEDGEKKKQKNDVHAPTESITHQSHDKPTAVLILHLCLAGGAKRAGGSSTGRRRNHNDRGKELEKAETEKPRIPPGKKKKVCSLVRGPREESKERE